MELETRPKCAVSACAEVAASIGNLCDRHQVPGVVFESPGRRYVITSWYAEQEGTRGIVVLNDFALGDLFGGIDGFKTKLREQGFENVCLLRTPEEFRNAKTHVAEAPGNWSGPWLIEYAWESGSK
jgi:hypothetical protein